MKNLVKLMLVGMLFGVVSCKKTNDPQGPTPPEDKEPLRVMQSIYTTENQGTLYTDTMSFTYDSDGRVTSRSSAKGHYTEQFIYTNGKLTSIKTVTPDGTSENLNTSVYSPDGDSIRLDFVSSSSTDTVQLTYIFNDGKQTDFWTYLHFNDINNCGCLPESTLQKEKWYYNSANNLVKKTLATPPSNEEQDWYTATSWDDKKNPKFGQPKLNALGLSLNVPMESFGANNVTSYSTGSYTYEVEITYNDQGYPLTFKLKDQNFVAARLIYNK